MTNEEVIVKVTDHGARIKSAEKRIEALEGKTDRIESLTLSVEKLAMSIKQMADEQAEYREKQNDIAKRLLEVENKPSKEKASVYDKVINTIITAICSGIVGFALSYFGLH